MNPKHQAPTISDVAKEAGVSLAAVSRVMSGDKSFVVRDETRKRITDAAKKLRYKPNPVARGLRTSKTYSLGIIVPELDNPVHARIIIGAERAAAERGYSLLIAHRDIGMSETAIYERLVRQNHVDGLIVATLQDEKVGVKTLNDLGNPYVLVNRKARGAKHHVVIDDRGGAQKAVEYLVTLGHHRIAHFSGSPKRYNSKCRLQGYKDGLQDSGLMFDEALVFEAGYTLQGGAAAARALLDAKVELPTAVFASTLFVAAGAMSVFRDTGIRIPADISVIGFNDGAIAEILAPPLTTVRTPLEKMGFEAATSLIDRIEGVATMGKQMLEESEIITRASTAKPKRSHPKKRS
ncbi:MAG: LacI family DNA-binding transcriptional regulator [Alphaproteobacteria bacterium]